MGVILKKVTILLLVSIVSIYLPSTKGFAAESSENQFYDSEHCLNYLSYWSKVGEPLTIFDKKGKPHFGRFQKFDRNTDSLYFIEKEFKNNIEIGTINYSDISKIVIEKKRLNMGQIKQATLIGSLLGFVGAVIVYKSNSDTYNRDSLKFKKIFLGFGIGAGVGVVAGLIGNDRIKTQKVLDCR